MTVRAPDHCGRGRCWCRRELSGTYLDWPRARSQGLPVAVRALTQDVQTDEAAISAHTWGVEALPAGEFLGTDDKVLRCSMQSALLRTDTTGFVVTDDAGQAVLVADL